MKAILLSLLGVALITSLGLSTFMYANNQDNEDLQATTTTSPYITFIEDSAIDNLMLQLQGQTDSDQLQILQSFIVQQRKFFNANSIMKVLMVMKEFQYPEKDTVRNTAILVMKPYIAPMSTNEALLIMKMIEPRDGIAAGVLVSQINDLNGSKDNITNLSNAMNPTTITDMYNIQQIILPYSTRVFYNNFQITFEGKHVGFLIDQSESMNTVVSTAADGTAITRYNMLESLFDIRQDIFKNFSAFSYAFTGNLQNSSCDSCPSSSYEEYKWLNAQVYNIRKCGGDNNLYSQLALLLSKPMDYLSDVYIWSDGIVTSGTKDVNEFVKLINSTNSQRKLKVRINTVSFLVGGNEDKTVKDEATHLLQTLADITNGTFIQVTAQN